MREASEKNLLRFVTGLYQQPGIETQCLAWQDQYGADIPLLLFICWYSVHQGRLSLAAQHELVQDSRMLSSLVVEPLRRIRRHMKQQSVPAARQTAWDQLREQVKQTELAAEFHVLAHLWEATRRYDVSSAPPVLSCNRELQKILELNLHDWGRAFPLRDFPRPDRSSADDIIYGGDQRARQVRSDASPFAALITATLRLASGAPDPGPDRTDPASAPHDDQ